MSASTPWLPPGLWLLVRLRVGGAIRDQWQRLRTPAGIITGLFGILFFGGWILPLVLLPSEARMIDPSWFGHVGPFGLLVVWAGQVFVRGGGEVLGFMPSEADQLFAAPYRPEDLLRYKVTLLIFAWVSGSLILSPMAMFYARHPLGGLFAILLVLPFLQLSAMVAAMLKRGGRQHPLRRIGFLAMVVGLPLVALRIQPDDDPEVWQTLGALLEHPVSGTLLAPFVSGTALLSAPTLLDLLPHAAVVFTADALLVAMLLRLGRGAWLEIAAEGAQHIQAAMRTYRTGGIGSMGGVGTTRVPMLPAWGGIGPVAWRRLLELVRRRTTLGAFGGVAALVLGIGIGVPWVFPGANGTLVGYAMLLTTVIWGTILIPGILRLDFRADLDRMDQLLALPVRPRALFLGQILPVVAAVSAFATLIFVAVAVWKPAVAPVAFLLALFEPAFALVVLAVENALFLWFPVRTEAGDAAIQSVGRNLLQSFLGWTFEGLAGGASAVLGVVVLGLTGSVVLTVIAAAVPLLAVAGLAIAAGSWRLSRFDPSADVPN